MASIKSLYRQHLKVTCVTVSTSGLATSQNTTANTPLTLNGALISGGTYTAGDCTDHKVGHLITVSSTANIAAYVFTVAGTDADGHAITDTITGINNSTVATTKYFNVVTSITPDTTDGTNTVTAGISAGIATQLILIEPRTSFAVGMGATISGTANVSAQLTMDDVLDPTVTGTFIADTTFASKTSTFFSSLGVLVTAIRFITSSYSTGAVVTFHCIQNKAPY